MVVITLLENVSLKFFIGFQQHQVPVSNRKLCDVHETNINFSLNIQIYFLLRIFGRVDDEKLSEEITVVLTVWATFWEIWPQRNCLLWKQEDE